MTDRVHFFGVPPLMLRPDSSGKFRVFLRRDGDQYLLYCSEREDFTLNKIQRLQDMGVDKVFIPKEDTGAYQEYARDNLGKILENNTIPVALRSKVFYQTSSNLVQEAFSQRLPHGISQGLFDQVTQLVDDCLDFLSSESNLSEIARLMSHDYQTYTHSVNVFILVMAILRAVGDYGEAELKQIGVGAVLHDIGKTQIPLEILNKPGKLTEEEFGIVKRHPTLGKDMGERMDLAPMTSDVLLYHHEKLDGSGYPSGAAEASIPPYIRAVTIADIYDALTSRRAYSRALKPYDALRKMQLEFEGHISRDIFVALVNILKDVQV